MSVILEAIKNSLDNFKKKDPPLGSFGAVLALFGVCMILGIGLLLLICIALSFPLTALALFCFIPVLWLIFCFIVAQIKD